MQVDIIKHDIEAGTATIRFSHNDVVITQTYDLKLVVPGTSMVFQQYGIAFDEAKQQQVIDRLTLQVQHEIEGGILTNPSAGG